MTAATRAASPRASTRATLTPFPTRATLTLGAAAALTLFAAGGCRSEGPARGNPVANAHPPVYTALPQRPVASSIAVQMAYDLDDGIVYGHFSWKAPDRHLDARWEYRSGSWSLRGVDARSAHSAAEAVAAEASLALAWTGTNGATGALPNFSSYGCALACHDTSTQMPDWTEDGAAASATMKLPITPYYANGGLDLWQWRAQTTAPAGYWSDQRIDHQGDPGSERHDDPGSGGARPNALIAGHPEFVYDPATTRSGGWAIPAAALATSPDSYFEDAAAPSPHAAGPTPRTLPWADAVAGGYTPREGDTVPYWVLADRGGGRADLLDQLTPDGGGTVFARSGYDPATGHYEVYVSRALDTGSPGSDWAFSVGAQAGLAIAVHRDDTRGRDHAVSLPIVLWFEDPNDPGGALGADYLVRQLRGVGTVPDFSDTDFYPVMEVDLFLPGLLSWEYLTDTRDAAYVFGNVHGGAGSLQAALNGPAIIRCRDCHVVRLDDPLADLVSGGPLELRTPRRGGIFEATPISLRDNVVPVLEARCDSCHAPGGVASSIPFGGVSEERRLRELLAPGRVLWENPESSPLLQVPARDLDGFHPPLGPLDGFADSPDFRRLRSWILYDAPDN